jgi:sulfoxide reductase heme-binding subunit YedZ
MTIMDIKTLLQQKIINQWSLYCLFCVPMSIAIIGTMMTVDMAAAEGVSSMIAYSVRWSIPFLYFAFAASALQLLFPSEWTRWLLRNRSIIGLCLATGMTGQIAFIITLVGWHRDYYVEEVYVLRDVIEGLTGYLFLFAMVVTSFKRWRKRLTSKQWKTLHTYGIYFLWAYAFSVYWHALFYYAEQPDAVDYLYYVGGLSAWALRLTAWCKKKLKKSVAVQGNSLALVSGVAILLFALFGVVSGSWWQGPVYENLYGFDFTLWLELYMPYWPFVPYLPLLIALPGAWLLIRGWRPQRYSS